MTGIEARGAERTPAEVCASSFVPASPAIAGSSLSLPASGGAVRGIGEKLGANPAMDTPAPNFQP